MLNHFDSLGSVKHGIVSRNGGYKNPKSRMSERGRRGAARTCGQVDVKVGLRGDCSRPTLAQVIRVPAGRQVLAAAARLVDCGCFEVRETSLVDLTLEQTEYFHNFFLYFGSLH